MTRVIREKQISDMRFEDRERIALRVAQLRGPERSNVTGARKKAAPAKVLG